MLSWFIYIKHNNLFHDHIMDKHHNKELKLINIYHGINLILDQICSNQLWCFLELY